MSNSGRLACSFCKKDQDVLRQLVAGPGGVNICDECVQVCVDITSDDRTQEPQAGVDAAPEGRFGEYRRCTLCRQSVRAEDSVPIEFRGVLCLACVSAVEEASRRAQRG
jgi:hypothetical protein